MYTCLYLYMQMKRPGQRDGLANKFPACVGILWVSNTNPEQCHMAHCSISNDLNFSMDPAGLEWCRSLCSLGCGLCLPSSLPADGYSCGWGRKCWPGTCWADFPLKSYFLPEFTFQEMEGQLLRLTSRECLTEIRSKHVQAFTGAQVQFYNLACL